MEPESKSFGLEGVAIALCLGPIFVQIFGSILLLLKIKFYSEFFLIPALLGFLFLWRPIFRGLSTKMRFSKFGKVEAALLTYIVFQLGYIFFVNGWRPIAMNDDWNHIAGKTKYLFYYHSVSPLFFKQESLSFYPNFIQNNELLFSTLLGRFDDFLCKTPVSIFFSSALIYFFCFFRRHSNLRQALVYCAFISSLPYFVRVGFDGTGEIPMSLLILLSIMFIYDWVHSQQKSDLVAALFFSGAILSVKLEGTYVVVGLWLSALLFYWASFKRVGAKSFLWSAAIMGANFLPWFLTLKLNQSTQTRWSHFTSQWLFQGTSYLEIAKSILSYFHPYKNTVLLGPYAFFALGHFFLARRRKQKFQFYLLFIHLYLVCCYTLGCYITGWAGIEKRLYLHLVGATILFIFFQFRDYDPLGRPKKDVGAIR
jgi:hypothetical protein